MTGPGIDYSGGGTVNRDPETGIHYGVISQNEVLQAWADSSEADYGKPEEAECPKCNQVFPIISGYAWGEEIECPECEHKFELELPDCSESIGFYLDDGEYQATCSDDGDIFVISSPYYTLCRFCSPCAPGAGYLMSPVKDGIKAYCFGHDWFDKGKAPYPIYRVDTGEEVKSNV